MENTETDFKVYTSEQEEKIEKLREQNEAERRQKHTQMERMSNIPAYQPLKVSDPVFLRLESKTISGYIMEIDETDRWKKLYTVKTPLGTVKNVPSNSIQLRHVEDLSHIVIPDEIKEYTTAHLLQILQGYRKGWSHAYWGTLPFSREVVKAELRRRPHVPTKRERKIFSKRTK
jgi:hypothetical protein